MDSDASGHSESEFCYPEEETLNQVAPINLFPNCFHASESQTVLNVKLDSERLKLIN